MKNNQIKPTIPQKILFVHSIFVLGVCLVFGIVNMIGGSFVIGGLIIGLGAVACALVFCLKNRTSIVLRGAILSIIQLCIIIVMSAAKHEMSDMFPLMVASMAISCIYFSKRLLVTHWAVMDVAAVVGIFMNDLFYGGAAFGGLVKGILGINVAGVILMYLVGCCLSFIGEASEAKAKADELLEKVQDQMAETERMADSQREVVKHIAEISGTLSESGEKMHSVADSISQAAEEQQSTIAEISDDIVSITTQTNQSLESAEAAARAAAESTHLLELGNEEIGKMISAMTEIEESSDKIRDIVKTIEDIAFQTNILALNASIEAARAGAAGKGFAVVADEVRNLAGKSQKAVESTAVLIDSSVNAVNRGREVADAVAQHMTSVMSVAEESAKHAHDIAKQTEVQVEAVAAVKDRMDQISVIIGNTSETAVQSAAIAGRVADDTRRMDDIVSSFRDDEL